MVAQMQRYPHHPWQRGTNENTNRLLRQYLHKNTDMGSFTQRQLNTVASKLNDRPRQILGWATPAEAFGVAWPQPMPLMPPWRGGAVRCWAAIMTT
jgi:IS30 family transposase